MISLYNLFMLTVFVAIGVLWQVNRQVPVSLVTSIYPIYDFIIVGGGTAGCVLSALLSENKNVRVLLIEAGGQFGHVAKIPLAPTLLQRGPYDWSFTTESQKYSSFGLFDKKQFLPRGKGLGGSGQINYMLHGLGLPADYNTWHDMGAHGWNYTELKPYFKSVFNRNIETCNQNYESSNCINKKHNIRLTGVDYNLQEINDIFLKSSEKISKDSKLSIHTFSNTIHNGHRQSSYLAYLHPALNRNNLHVLYDAIVSKINFKRHEATSVDILFENTLMQVSARKEIVLCSGAIQTPQLLMLSGIGPEIEMAKNNITEIHISENVGKNLHDHLNMPLYISVNEPVTMTLDKIKTFRTLYDYFQRGEGYLSSPGVVAMARTVDHSAVILFAMGSADEDLLREIANYKQKTFRSLFPFYNDTKKEGFIFLSSCLQPLSRGTIKIQSKDPRVPPIIDPNYLSHQHDISCTIKAIRLVEELISSSPFRDIGAAIHWPKIEECKHVDMTAGIGDEYLECIIRSAALTGHHAGGTCSMAGENPVVDPNLRVIGVRRLSIVDASIMPTPVSSPPNSVIISIAEKASSIIKQRHGIQ